MSSGNNSIRVGSRSISLCSAIITALIAVGIYSTLILYVNDVDRDASIKRFEDQQNAIFGMIAESTGKDIAGRIKEARGVNFYTLDLPVNQRVRAIAISNKAGESEAFKDFYIIENRALPNSRTVPLEIDLSKFGVSDYTAILYIFDESTYLVKGEGARAGSILAVIVIIGLIAFYLGYGFSSRRVDKSNEDESTPRLVGGMNKRMIKKKVAEDFDMRRYMTLLALKEVNDPASKIKNTFEAAIKELDRGDLLFARKQMVDGLRQFTHTSNIIEAVVNMSGSKKINLHPTFSWMPAREIFSSLEEGMSFCSAGKLDAGFRVVYEGHDADEILIDAEVVPLAISAGLGAIERYVKNGFVKIVGNVEKDLLVVTLIVNAASYVKNGDDILSADNGALGEGLEFVFSLARTIGASVSVQSVQNSGVVLHVGVSVKTRVGLPEIIKNDADDRKIEYINKDEHSFSTFFHNHGADGIKILVIDDNVDRMREIASKLSHEELRRTDVRVTFTSDPTEAIRQVEDIRYDSVVIKYGMPVLDALHFFAVLDDCEHDYSSASKILLANESVIPAHRKIMYNQMGVNILSYDVSILDIKNVVRKLSLRAI